MLTRIALSITAAVGLVLAMAAPAAALGSSVSGPGAANPGTTFQVTATYSILASDAIASGTSLRLRTVLVGAGPSPDFRGTLVADAPLPAGVSSCAAGLGGLGDPALNCDYTYPGGDATFDISYTVTVTGDAQPDEVWSFDSTILAGDGNPIGSNDVALEILIQDVGVTSSPTPTPTPTPSTTASTGAPVPTAVPAGAAPESGPSLPVALVLGSLALLATGVAGAVALRRAGAARH